MSSWCAIPGEQTSRPSGFIIRQAIRMSRSSVTGELTNLFISENQKVRQQESQGTTNFLEQQLEDARANLAAQEAKVREFEAQHEGALPDRRNKAILQIMDRLSVSTAKRTGCVEHCEAAERLP